MKALRLDRGCKYFMGLVQAQKFHPQHIMFFDADDFISNQIAEFANSNPHHNGWYIQDGYVYDEELKLFGTISNFHQVCGTSHIVRYELYQVAHDFPLNATQEHLLNHIDHDYLFKIIGSHRWLAEHLASQGNQLEPLPFRGALYYIGNGENHTSRAISCALWVGGVERLEVVESTRLKDLSEEFNISVSRQ